MKSSGDALTARIHAMEHQTAPAVKVLVASNTGTSGRGKRVSVQTRTLPGSAISWACAMRWRADACPGARRRCCWSSEDTAPPVDQPTVRDRGWWQQRRHAVVFDVVHGGWADAGIGWPNAGRVRVGL